MTAATAKPCPACGKIHRVEAVHYDRIITDCGRPWFVLQPKRNGPLVLFPHPGPALTRREYAEKYGIEPAEQS
jgi:hypothetical protein